MPDISLPVSPQFLRPLPFPFVWSSTHDYFEINLKALPSTAVLATFLSQTSAAVELNFIIHLFSHLLSIPPFLHPPSRTCCADICDAFSSSWLSLSSAVISVFLSVGKVPAKICSPH